MEAPMIVGDLRIDGVIDGGGKFRPEKAFRGTTPEMWQAHKDLLDEDGMLPLTLGGYLVRDGKRTVLIDAGLGPGSLMGLVGGAMMDNLAALGVTPAEITDVIFTHLHIDHIGWATQGGQTTFPNATYRCSVADWEHFMVEHPDEPDNYPGAEGIPVNPHAVLVHATPSSTRTTARDDPARRRHHGRSRATRRAAPSSCCPPRRTGPCCSATSCTARSSCSNRSGTV